MEDAIDLRVIVVDSKDAANLAAIQETLLSIDTTDSTASLVADLSKTLVQAWAKLPAGMPSAVLTPVCISSISFRLSVTEELITSLCLYFSLS